MSVTFSVNQGYVAWLILASLIPLSMRIFSFLIPRARGWGLIDRPGGRHIHAMPVAVVGGLGVISTWFVGLIAWTVFYPSWTRANAQELGVTLGCAITVLALGILDDSKGIGPRARLLAELAIGAVTVAFVPSVTQFCLELSPLIGPAVYPLTAVGIAGVMNAMNLVDGMDGLAGTMFLTLAAALSVLAGPLGAEPEMSGLSAMFLVPGIIAFLRKNWNPAATFMGDQGSLAIGYLLVTSALGIRFHGSRHGLTDLCALAAVFSYPVLDMFICMMRRWRSRLPMTTGDRNHLHHRMLRLGLSPRESVVTLATWQAAMLIPIILLRVLPAEWVPLVPLISAAIAAERLVLLGRIEIARLRQLQARVDILLRPRGLPPVESTFVRARVCIPLKPMLEAAQFEERGCLEQMIESLRFFCERKAKNKGFVQLTESEVVVHLVGAPDGAPTPEELRAEWSESLKSFSQAFRLTYSTWNLPVRVLTATSVSESEERDDVAEAA